MTQKICYHNNTKDNALTKRKRPTKSIKIWNPMKEFNLGNLDNNLLGKIQQKNLKRVKFGDSKSLGDYLEIFIKNSKNPWTSKNGYNVYTCFIKQDEDEENDIFLQFYESLSYIPEKDDYEESLCLWSIYIPTKFRQLGIGTKVMKTLEQKAKNERRYFLVNMITSDEMMNLCKKMGYQPSPPVCLNKSNVSRIPLYQIKNIP